MTTPRSYDSVALDGVVRAGKGRVLVAASIRAHPHIPRRRKSANPLRDSGASASPKVAIRRISYWAKIIESYDEHSAVDSVITWKFFLQRPRARSSSDAHRGRILGGSTSPARAPGSARQEPAAPEKRQHLPADLVRTVRASLLGHQPGDARFVEVRLGLVIGRS